MTREEFTEALKNSPPINPYQEEHDKQLYDQCMEEVMPEAHAYWRGLAATKITARKAAIDEAYSKGVKDGRRFYHVLPEKTSSSGGWWVAAFILVMATVGLGTYAYLTPGEFAFENLIPDIVEPNEGAIHND